MKKFVSVILCISLILPVITVDSFAKSEERKLSFADKFEQFTGIVSSVFVRYFNSLFNVDEGNIEEAEEQPVSYENISDCFVTASPDVTLNCETWVMNEVTFESEKQYLDPFSDVTLDLVLDGCGRRYKIPAFWDGNNTYKARFVCPLPGTWYFKTVCSDTLNTSLHNKTGKVVCSQYNGEYEIYKNGFVTTKYLKKYFTYDNGTPFLYLGDTHWSLGDETEEMVKIISEKRYSQGFTVIQSEPIGALFKTENGITAEDIEGFKSYDRKFKTIADNGLVHANAEFFFPSDMESLIQLNGGYSDAFTTVKIDGKKVQVHELSEKAKSYLEKLTRYWVARYGAFPVLWTLGQEVDNDFYWREDNHGQWCYYNNPYKLVAEYIDKYDAYDHPISAHQENSGSTAAYGNGKNASDKCKVYRNAETSAFRDVKEHTWYAAQWSPDKTKQSKFEVEKDYWYNSQGKPSINYEGAYCYLWTKNFGSRMQGWNAYLNGLYGYGWGGHDTWSYLNIYDEENDSSDGLDTITSQEKTAATWRDSLEYESSYQCGYMLDFLKNIEWYNLIPRFDNKAYFKPCSKVYYSCASNKDNTQMVVYFYSFSDSSIAEKTNSSARGGVSTGTVGNLLPGTEYHYKWFNPVNGEYSKEYSFTSTAFGTYYIGEKSATDMILYLYK